MTRRGQILVRMLRLMRRLDGCKFRPNVHLLAEELGVSYRTIYRDFEALEEAHIPLPPVYEEQY